MINSENPPMFEVLDETDGDVVAVRVSTGSRDGYKDLYELLVSKTEEHGTIYVYEEVPDWTGFTFLSHLHGVIPDLRYGPKFNISKYAAVGASVWSKLLFDLWFVVRPVWPVDPDRVSCNLVPYFDITGGVEHR
jgi:hypothetical protein